MKTNISALEKLATVRKNIWSIQQAMVEKKDPSAVRKDLGLLSNKILEYILDHLTRTQNLTELISGLEALVHVSDTPLFQEVLDDIQQGSKRVGDKICELGVEAPISVLYIHAKKLFDSHGQEYEQ